MIEMSKTNKSYFGKEERFRENSKDNTKYLSKDHSRDLQQELESMPSPNFSNNYNNLELPPRPKKKEFGWEDKLANINKKSNLKKEIEGDSMYKLNVRSSSAWERQTENTVHLDPKFSSIVSNFV